jgi:hypothetical protein
LAFEQEGDARRNLRNTRLVPDDARFSPEQFGAAFQSFLEWAREFPGADDRSDVSVLIEDFLGPGASERSVVAKVLPPFEHVNLQAALDAWSDDSGREVIIHGISLPPHHGAVDLQQLIMAEGLRHVRLSPPAFADLPSGPSSTLACLQYAVLLVSDGRGRYVLLVRAPGEHDPRLVVEIAGLAVEDAQGVHAELERLRHELNVYRGQVLDVGVSEMGNVTLSFAAAPQIARAAVVLPVAVMDRVERHAVGVSSHRQALLAAGQHLKRGLLLYGPPGTGKTHTTRYLVGQMAGYTRLTLTGRALRVIGQVADLARELEPSMIVLEDVDLVAEHRTAGPAASPVLFDLLDAMDGAAPDADLLFVLTTNRADLLEPALAARPGRVDVAIEIALPEPDARDKLLLLYAGSLPLHLSDAEREQIVTRTEGVTASFLKELLRRATLEALSDDPALTTVTAEHVGRALDDLLDGGQQLTRSLLGVGNDPESLPPGGGAGALPPQSGRARAMMRRMS